MHFPDPPPAYQLSIILSFLTLTLAQDTTPQTIYSLSAFTMQKPCAQDCFTFSQLGCISDVLAGAIGCQNNYCSANFGAPDNCYCRTDLQSAAESFLTSCVSKSCTVGDSSIDVSSAGSIYENYCSSKGFPVAAAATTTPAASVQAATTVASSSPPETSSPGNNVDGGVSSPGTATTSKNENPSSTDSGSGTTVASSAPSSSQGGGGGGLSTSDMIALGIGIGLGIPTLLIGIPACIIAMRNL